MNTIKFIFALVLFCQFSFAASIDCDVEWDGILHDSRSSGHHGRMPGFRESGTGAVPFNKPLYLKIRTFHNDVVSVQVRVWWMQNKQNTLTGERWYEGTKSGSDHEKKFDYWTIRIPPPGEPTVAFYRFHLADRLRGCVREAYYGDDDGFNGTGKVYGHYHKTRDFTVTFYDPNFKTPDWAKGAVMYQIFPDSFFNGFTGNDPVGDGLTGDVNWWAWDWNGNDIMDEVETRSMVVKKLADSEPRENTPQLGRDYYGGDLNGVVEKLSYFVDGSQEHSLGGVKILYFNPITFGPDNHAYAVSDYFLPGPYFTATKSLDELGIRGRWRDARYNSISISESARKELIQDFTTHVKRFKDAGIRIVLDTVFNHVSAQSKYFKRFEQGNGFVTPDPYPTVVGAYESPESPYFSWFRFHEYNHSFDAWWGFSNIPTIKWENFRVGEGPYYEFLNQEKNYFNFWTGLGTDGFRLDVADDFDDGNASYTVNSEIRKVSKKENPDSLIIGEIWHEPAAWLSGNMLDSVMNYVFQKAVINWLNFNISSREFTERLLFVKETVPPEAYMVLMNLLGSHDTARVLTIFGGVQWKVRLASAIQFTLAGIPSIYYGDEVGMHGKKDASCRNRMEWGRANPGNNLFVFMKKLTAMRDRHRKFFSYSDLVFRSSSHPDNDNVVTFSRKSNKEFVLVALYRGNGNGTEAVVGNLDGNLENGSVLKDVLSGATYTVSGCGESREGCKIRIPLNASSRVSILMRVL